MLRVRRAEARAPHRLPCHRPGDLHGGRTSSHSYRTKALGPHRLVFEAMGATGTVSIQASGGGSRVDVELTATAFAESELADD